MIITTTLLLRRFDLLTGRDCGRDCGDCVVVVEEVAVEEVDEEVVGAGCMKVATFFDSFCSRCFSCSYFVRVAQDSFFPRKNVVALSASWMALN